MRRPLRRLGVGSEAEVAVNRSLETNTRWMTEFWMRFLRVTDGFRPLVLIEIRRVRGES